MEAPKYNIHFQKSKATYDFLIKHKQISASSAMNFLDKDLYEQMKSENLHGQSLLERLDEVISIEKEKLKYRSSKTEMKLTLELELEIYQSRESILLTEVEGLKQEKFVLNPLLKLCQSDWDWNPLEGKFGEKNLRYLFNSAKSDFFFVFQTTGVYFESIDSNVLEMPITNYHYFLLCLAENPIVLNKLITTFQGEFDVESVQEKRELESLTNVLIKELLFRTFLVPERCS